MMKECSVEELRAMLNGQSPGLLLHVPSSNSFDEAHIPDAQNICVYEMGFLDEVAKATKNDFTTPVTVYGLSDDFMASVKAAELLTEAGYTNVSRLKGGLQAWEASGEPVEKSSTPAESKFKDGAYPINSESSAVHWIGRNLSNAHDGTLEVSRGTLNVENGTLRSGRVEVDFSSMRVLDIKDSDMSSLLIQHLLSDDFFAADEFPSATFEWAEVTKLDVLPGQPNHLIHGQMTLRGVTQPLKMEATVGQGSQGEVALQSHFDLDRTQWNVQYGSGKIFESLGMHLVNDHISINLRVISHPPKENS